MQSPGQSSPFPPDMDKDETLLCRLAVNHLFLSQFEAFRAIILSLKRRNPELSLAILQTVVANGGKFENIIYSTNCSSPALLAWLCSSELLRFDNPSSVWSVSPDTIKLRVEFLLYMQMISDKVLNGARDLSGADDGASVVVVLRELRELGFSRLKEDLVGVNEGEHTEFLNGDRLGVEEEQLKCLMPVVLENADVFDALCVNISKQVGVTEPDYDNSGLALTLRREGQGVALEKDLRVMKSIRKVVQLAHLEAMEVGINEDDSDGVIGHIQYLHLDSGVEEAKYRAVLQDFLKKILSGKEEGYEDAWIATREKLLLTYQEALSSNCTRLVQMIQDVQDELLAEEIAAHKSNGNQNMRPLQQFQDYLAKLKLNSQTKDNISLTLAMRSCLTDMYHHARVAGLHVLDCVVDAALSAVKKENLEEASNILNLYPRLQPLVAIMGWDLLPNRNAARRKLMQMLWTSKLQAYRLEAASHDENLSDERSCTEHLCDALCYQLDIAAYVACVNSGKPWDLKISLFFSGEEKLLSEDECLNNDTFVENFVLERLSFQSPLRVLFDVVPNIMFKDAIELIRMQPISSSMAAWKRDQDIELLHMRYGIEYAAMGIGAMEKIDYEDDEDLFQIVLFLLKEIKHHIEAIESIPRKVVMVNIIISLLHMNNISANWEYGGSSWRQFVESSVTKEYDFTSDQGENRNVILVIETLLGILRCNLPLPYALEDNELDNGLQAMEWRISGAKHFVDDWEWRLLILKQLLPFSEGTWKWKDAITILRAAPSKLLNFCMQRGKYGIGEEVVGHFSLPPEDTTTLALAEWVCSSKEVSVEDADGPTIDETATLKEIDFSLLRTQIGPLATILLCIDVAVASARSKKVAHQLLDQAQSVLSEIYPGGSPKIGSAFWDQIREVALISMTKRLLKCLNEILEQGSTSFQAFLSGEITVPSSNRQGQRDRALAMLHQMIEDAHEGKRQFLSGKLHNLARAVADEESGVDFMRSEGTYREQKFILDFEGPGILGLGLRGSKQASSSLAADHNVQPAAYDVKETGKRIYRSLSVKPTTYLSQFILHISAIGDIVDGTDTTHDFNYFSLVYEWPKDLVTRLVFEQASTEAAEKVAEIMSTDFVHDVISACVPPVYPPLSGHGWAYIPLFPLNCKSRYGSQTFSSSAREFNVIESGVTQYPLRLDIIKHLVKASPVRAVLACVFGSRMLRRASESSISGSLENELMPAPDIDRMFYEFALDQSERFPTLNRWIQMQTNLHRVSEFTEASKDTTEDVDVKAEVKLVMKRAREDDRESDFVVEQSNVVDDNTPATPDLTFRGCNPYVPQGGSMDYDVPEDALKVCLTFDWENEEPYEKAVDRLIEEGNLLDALALSDRFLGLGASDHLLKLLIERDEESTTNSRNLQGYVVQSAWSNSWQYCLRLKDKQLAAKLALKYLHKWELDASLDVLTMCSCHLPQDELLKFEVLHRRQALERYKRILCADDCCTSWQEVEAMCKEDPEGLALKLAERGAVSAALEVAESACLSIDLRRELQGRQLVKLLTADPLNGGGPAEASRFLSSLHESDDALPVVMGAMQLLPDLRSKQLLVHFFLKRRDGNLTDIAVTRLNSWALGLKVLSALPLPWQQRCSSLHEHPHLILEVLLMRKQLDSASLILKEFPSLQNNSVVLSYAAKAITVSISLSSREPRVSVSGQMLKQKTRTSTPPKSSLSSSLSNFHREARRAFSWNARNGSEKPAPKETQKKRKSSGLMAADKNAWEAMTGIQEDRVSSYPVDGQERRVSASIAEEWMLSGDLPKDESVRASHRYDSAPDVTLFKSLLSLCADESVSARGAMDLCVSQMKIVLSSKQLPETASTETIGQAYRATEAFVQGLLHARSLLRKLVGGSDTSSGFERSRDTDDTSSDAGSSSIGSQVADEISEILLQADIWLRRAELLQSLLGSGIAASLDDIADEDSSSRLRDRLIVDERYGMAVYTCRKCKIDVFPVWNAWGHALLRTEHYDQARVKFNLQVRNKRGYKSLPNSMMRRQVLQLYDDDPAPVIREIVNTIEGSPPVDVSIARSMYEHLAKSAPAILDDSLSADSYLNVLHMPSTYPRSERSGSSLESTSDGTINGLIIDDGPRSNLDSLRYLECVNYLQEYTRQDLLHFMFRHGHFEEACTLFFPPNSIPPPSQPSSLRAVTTSSSPQRPDTLATDYGTIDDLCDACIGYGAMSVLEEAMAARKENAVSQDAAVNLHTDEALARICNYCETHKHFNYLYKFQVIKKDHVAAGLCCVQLFINSSSLEDAIKHLENAKMHFDEGLSARYKTGESTKVVTKGVRGRSASEKLTEEGLVKLSSRVAIQGDVVRSFNDIEGPQWKYSLFGNPNDQETFRRRCQVAESLVEKNFDLAFRVICEFGLPAVDIYAAVASSLAERKRAPQLTELFKNVKGMIDDDDWDQVLGAAINVYANKHKERPDRLIDMLTSSHRKVLACVVSGRLKTAFQFASRSGSVADVQYVAHQALHSNALPVLDMCKQWLAQYM